MASSRTGNLPHTGEIDEAEAGPARAPPQPPISFRPPARVNSGFKAERRVGRLLRDLDVSILHGAFIAEGENQRELDFLALIGDRIWIVEVKSSAGFPSRRAAGEGRLVGPATVEKARRQIRRQTEALTRLLPGVPVAGVVVFSEPVRFHQPCPEAITLDMLPELVAREQGGSPSPRTAAAWQALSGLQPDGRI